MSLDEKLVDDIYMSNQKKKIDEKTWHESYETWNLCEQLYISL